MSSYQHLYYFLNRKDFREYMKVGTRNYSYPNERIIGYGYVKFAVGKTTDVPAALITGYNANSLRPYILQDKSMIVYPYNVVCYPNRAADRSYRNGLEHSLYYAKDARETCAEPGELIEIFPEFKKDGKTLNGNRFYVGNGCVFNHEGKLLIGTFVRMTKLGWRKYHLENCVLKVAEEVFTKQDDPLNKILIKEVISSVLQSQFKFDIPVGDGDMWCKHIGTCAVMLPVIMEINPTINPNKEVLPPTPGFDDAAICREAANYVDNAK